MYCTAVIRTRLSSVGLASDMSAPVLLILGVQPLDQGGVFLRVLVSVQVARHDLQHAETVAQLKRQGRVEHLARRDLGNVLVGGHVGGERMIARNAASGSHAPQVETLAQPLAGVIQAAADVASTLRGVDADLRAVKGPALHRIVVREVPAIGEVLPGPQRVVVVPEDDERAGHPHDPIAGVHGHNLPFGEHARLALELLGLPGPHVGIDTPAEVDDRGDVLRPGLADADLHGTSRGVRALLRRLTDRPRWALRLVSSDGRTGALKNTQKRGLEEPLFYRAGRRE
jgi:hypothetical protein